jgi:hypothetical protein
MIRSKSEENYQTKFRLETRDSTEDSDTLVQINAK